MRGAVPSFSISFHGEVFSQAQKHAYLIREVVTSVSFESETKLQETFSCVMSLLGT
jgi:hypothetical protein